MKPTWRTAWRQQSILVFRDEVEVDRLAADEIERVTFVYRGEGAFPGEIGTTVVELGSEVVLFDAETGFAGRINFERQAYWQARRCVYWVPAAKAVLPWRLRLAGWSADAAGRACRRVARAELESAIGRWQLEGPETWDERKRRRLEQSRTFGFRGATRLRA